MNIVYFGSLRDPSGYGEAARGNVLALNNLGVEVKAECIRHHQGDDAFLLPVVSERLATLMEKPTVKPYIKIHHQTPEYYGHPPRDEAAKFINRKLLQELGNGTYNIGYTVIEVNRIHPYWVDQMNLMDEIWTSSKFCRDIFIECGVQTPIKVMPHGVDTDFYRPLAEPLPIKNKADFNFLSIFQWTPRKAPDILLAAYLQEFSAEDDVSLTLRVYGSSTSQAERQRVIKMLKRIESDDLDIRHRHPKILLLHDFIPTSKIPSLYTAADCFVLPCFSEDTRALTSQGLKNYQDLRRGELVWTKNPVTHRLELKPIIKIYLSEHAGEMIFIKNCQINQLVTPNHRIYYSTPKVRNKLLVRSAKDFLGNKTTRYYIPTCGLWEGSEADYVNVEGVLGRKQESVISDKYDKWVEANSLHEKGWAPTKISKHINVPMGTVYSWLYTDATPWGNSRLLPSKVKTSTILAIIGWYIAEGSIYESKKAGAVITFSVYDEVDETSLSNLIREIKLKHSVSNGKVVVCSKILAEILKVCGKGAHNKRIPEWCLQFSPKLLKYLYDALIKGDGTRKGHHVSYYTVSDELRDKFIELCLKMNYAVNFFLRNHEERMIEGRTLKESTDWMINVREKHNKGSFKKNQVSQVQYSGKVWCVEVENGNIFVERDGIISVSGNSRGEGFGLPYLEAMSCGLPVIGTAWSAMTEFMNPCNSYLVRPDRLGPCKGMEHIPWYQHWMQWAEPCVNELRYMMRQVFENRNEAQEKAKIARKDVVEKYDWSVTGRLMKERLTAVWKRREKWGVSKQSA